MVKNRKRIHRFFVGVELFGPIQGETRKFIKGLILPFYQLYAEKAATKMDGFASIYDPYGPAILLKDDSVPILYDIEALITEYKDQNDDAIVRELERFKLLLLQAQAIEGYAVVITPNFYDLFIADKTKWDF